jgi:hypothetical protein
VRYFHAKLSLLPDADIGVFVAVNNDEGFGLTRELPNILFRRFIPGADAKITSTEHSQVEADARYAGMYNSIRRNFTTVEKVTGALQSVHIERTPNGYLRMGASLWEQVGTREFIGVSEENAGRKLRFVEDGKGRISGMATGVQYWTRAGILDDYRFLITMLAATVLAAGCGLVGFWRRRSFTTSWSKGLSEIGGRHDIALGMTIALWAASCFALTIAALELSGMISFGPPSAVAYPGLMLRIAVFLGHAAAVGVILLAVFLYQTWRLPEWSVPQKLTHSAIVLIMAITVATMTHWKLLMAPFLPS